MIDRIIRVLSHWILVTLFVYRWMVIVIIIIIIIIITVSYTHLTLPTICSV